MFIVLIFSKSVYGFSWVAAVGDGYASVLINLCVLTSSLSWAVRVHLDVRFSAANLRLDSAGFRCGRSNCQRRMSVKK